MYSRRQDQSAKEIQVNYRYLQGKDTETRNATVVMRAPEWVSNCFESLKAGPLANVQMILPNKKIKHSHQFTLRDLYLLARNESSNVTGNINKSLYRNIPRDVILALKDLVKFTTVVGITPAVGYGGFKVPVSEFNSPTEVVLCDSMGLQFQTPENTGRLVLISKNPLPQGALDNYIYQKLTGEANKKTFAECEKDISGRYERVQAFGQIVYFDSLAYRRFIAEDLITAARSVQEAANSLHTKVNFKFLKQGTGFFAGDFKENINRHFNQAVYEGLKVFFRDYYDPTKFGSIEFPFYTEDKRISDLCANHRVKCNFSKEDALSPNPSGFMTATTNCSDPHAATGNEMGYSSVDASIANNLLDKGNDFSPLLNPFMKDATLTNKHSPSMFFESDMAVKLSRFQGQPNAKSLVSAVNSLLGNGSASDNESYKYLVERTGKMLDSLLIPKPHNKAQTDSQLEMLKVYENDCKTKLALSTEYKKILTTIIASAVGFVIGVTIGLAIGFSAGLPLGPCAIVTAVLGACGGGMLGATTGISLFQKPAIVRDFTAVAEETKQYICGKKP